MGRSIGGSRRMVALASILLLAVTAMATACAGDDDEDAGDAGGADGEGRSGDDVGEPELRDELLEMMDADQAERTGEVGANNDGERTDRLREIVDDTGWPTFDQVGRDGATAAWLIAQHSDQDVEFQEHALELLRAAVDDDQGDPSELAYLEDRVAVNNEQPQTYGTQVRCGLNGAVPATPLVDADHVDQLRADVGLDPLEDYLAEFEEGCAAETSTP